jgi:hypothetical protein
MSYGEVLLMSHDMVVEYAENPGRDGPEDLVCEPFADQQTSARAQITTHALSRPLNARNQHYGKRGSGYAVEHVAREPEGVRLDRRFVQGDKRNRFSCRDQSPTNPSRSDTAQREEFLIPSSERGRPLSANPLRRRTVRWNVREVDALVVGVQRKGVGRWASILKGSDAFNRVRTSVDLKDKWRNMTSPVRAQALRSFEELSKNREGSAAGDDAMEDEEFDEKNMDLREPGCVKQSVGLSRMPAEGLCYGVSNLDAWGGRPGDKYGKVSSNGDRDGNEASERRVTCEGDRGDKQRGKKTLCPQIRRKEHDVAFAEITESHALHVGMYSAESSVLGGLGAEAGHERRTREGPDSMPHFSLQAAINDNVPSFTDSSVTPPFGDDGPAASLSAEDISLDRGHQAYHQSQSFGTAGSLQGDTGVDGDDLPYFGSQFHIKAEMGLGGSGQGILGKDEDASDDLGFTEPSISDLV